MYSGRDGTLLRSLTLAGSVNTGALVDDLDGYGIAEMAFGAQLNPISGSRSGVLYIVSPATGEVLLERPGPDDEPSFASSATAYASDTANTLLVGSPAPNPFPSTIGRAHVVSPRDGSIVGDLPPPADATYLFGTRALQTDDLNGDGVRDALVTDPAAPRGAYFGRITALSGSDGSVLWAYTGGAGHDPDLLGGDITVPGDLNQDGVPDVVAGVPNHAALDEAETGEVLAIDGRTGKQLWAIEGRRGGEGLGHGLATVGDLDGDGIADVIVGAPTFGLSTILLGQGGRFSILSGRSGAVLVDVESRIGFSERSDYFGATVDSLGDIDGDGLSVVVGAPRAGPGGQPNAGFVTAWSCQAK